MTDFEKRMIAEHRCTGCGVGLGASTHRECLDCSRHRHPQIETKYDSGDGKNAIKYEYRKRLGYGTR